MLNGANLTCCGNPLFSKMAAPSATILAEAVRYTPHFGRKPMDIHGTAATTSSPSTSTPR